MAATTELPRKIRGKSASRAENRPRRRAWLPIADAYVLRAVIEASFRGLCWFAGLFLAFTIVTAARRMAQDALPISLVLKAIALQMPRVVLFTIPASLLFGTVSTFTELSSKGEITALMAGGMGLRRMLRAPLVFAALMSVFAFYLQEVVVPDAEAGKDNIMKGSVSQIGEQADFQRIVYGDAGNIKTIVQAAAFNPSQKSLTKPVIQLFRPDNTVELEIQAQSARWDTQTASWTFVSGETRVKPLSRDGQATFDVRTPFKELALKTDVVPAPDKGLNVTKADRLRNHNYEMVSLLDLDNHRKNLASRAARQSGSVREKIVKDINATTFGIHDKIATPLVCIAMILIGAPLGIRPQRSASSGLAMGLSLAVLILYYIIWTLATSWGKGGGSAPVFAAYLSFLITAGVGAVMVARKS